MSGTMNPPLFRTALAVVAAGIFQVQALEFQSPLHVVYLGDMEGERAASYGAFLRNHFTRVEVAPRNGPHDQAVQEADVVLLDWPQGIDPFPPKRSPLGNREDWSKPTVLLGSAGLNLAVVWQLIGGSG